MSPSKLSSSSLLHLAPESMVPDVVDIVASAAASAAAAAAAASEEMNENATNQHTPPPPPITVSTIRSSSTADIIPMVAEQDVVGGNSSSGSSNTGSAVVDVATTTAPFQYRRRRNFRQTASALELQLEEELIQERIRWCHEWQCQPIQQGRQRKNEKAQKQAKKMEQHRQWRLQEHKIRCDQQKRLLQHYQQQQRQQTVTKSKKRTNTVNPQHQQQQPDCCKEEEDTDLFTKLVCSLQKTNSCTNSISSSIAMDSNLDKNKKASQHDIIITTTTTNKNDKEMIVNQSTNIVESTNTTTTPFFIDTTTEPIPFRSPQDELNDDGTINDMMSDLEPPTITLPPTNAILDQFALPWTASPSTRTTRQKSNDTMIFVVPENQVWGLVEGIVTTTPANDSTTTNQFRDNYFEEIHAGRLDVLPIQQNGHIMELLPNKNTIQAGLWKIIVGMANFNAMEPKLIRLVHEEYETMEHFHQQDGFVRQSFNPSIQRSNSNDCFQQRQQFVVSLGLIAFSGCSSNHLTDSIYSVIAEQFHQKWKQICLNECNSNRIVPLEATQIQDSNKTITGGFITPVTAHLLDECTYTIDLYLHNNVVMAVQIWFTAGHATLSSSCISTTNCSQMNHLTHPYPTQQQQHDQNDSQTNTKRSNVSTVSETKSKKRKVTSLTPAFVPSSSSTSNKNIILDGTTKNQNEFVPDFNDSNQTIICSNMNQTSNTSMDIDLDPTTTSSAFGPSFSSSSLDMECSVVSMLGPCAPIQPTRIQYLKETTNIPIPTPPSTTPKNCDTSIPLSHSGTLPVSQPPTYTRDVLVNGSSSCSSTVTNLPHQSTTTTAAALPFVTPAIATTTTTTTSSTPPPPSSSSSSNLSSIQKIWNNSFPSIVLDDCFLATEDVGSSNERNHRTIQSKDSNPLNTILPPNASTTMESNHSTMKFQVDRFQSSSHKMSQLEHKLENDNDNDTSPDMDEFVECVSTWILAMTTLSVFAPVLVQLFVVLLDNMIDSEKQIK